MWNVDLTTPDGARGAAQIGGLACLIAAILGGLGLILIAVSGLIVSLPGLALTVGEIAIYAIAAVRLRAGKGLGWGSAAAVMLVLETAFKIWLSVRTMTAMGPIGVMIDVVLLIALVNGLRGAAALRHTVDVDDAVEVFR